jgi:hypothetical protein
MTRIQRITLFRILTLRDAKSICLAASGSPPSPVTF